MPRRVAVTLLLSPSCKDTETQMSNSYIMTGNLMSVFNALKRNKRTETLKDYH